MAFTYNLATDVGRVRLLIFDANPVMYTFEDAELTAFVAMEGGRIKRGAALALESLASNEAYTQKAIRLLDLTTDGPKTSDALLRRAAELRKQDAEDVAIEEAQSGAGFEVAEWWLGPVTDLDALRRWGY